MREAANSKSQHDDLYQEFSELRNYTRELWQEEHEPKLLHENKLLCNGREFLTKNHPYNGFKNYTINQCNSKCFETQGCKSFVMFKTGPQAKSCYLFKTDKDCPKKNQLVTDEHADSFAPSLSLEEHIKEVDERQTLGELKRRKESK